jgi:16S rRNA (uracil1498-N3)-methyltransferase
MDSRLFCFIITLNMKIHRFIGRLPIATGTLRIDDADLAHQMRSVLKLAPGEVIIIGDGSGNEAQCRILRYDHDAIILDGMSVGKNANEPAVHVTLYCAVLKSDNFELAAQKATEVGISEIVPVITEHTVKTNLRVDRVQKIVREAAEVAGRGLVPPVREPLAFEKALTRTSDNDVNFFFDPSGRQFSGVAKNVRNAGVWIGPEGGWSEKEVERAKELGMRIVSLGGLVMRAETAATVSSYIVVHGQKS